MACGAFKDWTAGELVAQSSEAEKLFLKDLYSYMKKRGSPIERVPNLGFKQSNSTLCTCLITVPFFFFTNHIIALVVPSQLELLLF